MLCTEPIITVVYVALKNIEDPSYVLSRALHRKLHTSPLPSPGPLQQGKRLTQSMGTSLV